MNIHMQVIIVAFAAVVLGVGILAKTSEEARATIPPKSVLGSNAAEVAIEESEETPSPSPSPTASPTPVVTNSVSTSSLSDFIYPNANVTSSNESKVEMTTNVDPSTVTDWYKNKMKEKDFSVRNTVKTSTNGIVNNQLAGSNGDYGVEVSITKGANSSTSTITVRKN